jgi:hypothetical protein
MSKTNTKSYIQGSLPLKICQRMTDIPLIEFRSPLFEMTRFRFPTGVPQFNARMPYIFAEQGPAVDAMVEGVPYEVKFNIYKEDDLEIVGRQDYMFNAFNNVLEHAAPALGRYLTIEQFLTCGVQTPNFIAGWYREKDEVCMEYEAMAFTDLAIMAIVAMLASRNVDRCVKSLAILQGFLDQYNETGRVVYPKNPPHQKWCFRLSHLPVTQDYNFNFFYFENVRDLPDVPPNNDYCTTVALKKNTAKMRDEMAELKDEIAKLREELAALRIVEPFVK